MNDPKRIRGRVSYKWFDELIKAYDLKNKEEFFKKLHKALDDKRFWGSRTMSDTAMESLNLAIQDAAVAYWFGTSEGGES